MATSDDVLKVFCSDIKQILGFVSNTKYLTFFKTRQIQHCRYADALVRLSEVLLKIFYRWIIYIRSPDGSTKLQFAEILKY